MPGERAQSESVGVAMLTGVVIIVVAGAGGVILSGQGGYGVSDSGEPLSDVQVELTTQKVTLTHAGGDSVRFEDVEVILRGETVEHRFTTNAANATGSDGRFDASERWSRDHDIASPSARVYVVHTPSNAVLFERSIDVLEPGEQYPPVARFSYSPGPYPDPGDVTFDASASEDNDGSITSYEWDFDGDGTTDATGQTVTRTYASEGIYTVDLTVTDDDGATDSTTETVWVTTLRPPDDPDAVTSGLNYEYYEDGYTSLPDFETEVPEDTGTVDDFDISVRQRDDDFAFRYSGYVEVPENGTYTFYTESDDGSELYIGDRLVVDNGGQHPVTEESGTIDLQAGYHEITVTHFEAAGTQSLDVRWEGPGISKTAIPDGRLYRDDAPVATFDPDCDAMACDFDASGSRYDGGSIQEYRWRFGDGGASTTPSPTISHSYGSEGTHVVNLTVVGDDGRTSSTEREVTVEEPRAAVNPADTTGGLAYTYYEDATVDDLGDLTPSTIVRNGTTDQFDLDPTHREDDFGFRYTGYVEVPETGTYTFYTTSDDGSRLFVHGGRVVNNDGLHADQTRSGEIALEAGRHPVTVTYFEHTVDDTLTVEYEGPGVGRQVIPASALTRDREVARWESTADWDGAVSEASVVHDTFGDRSSDVVELGAPGFDRGGSNLTAYWPLDEDSGATATDVAGGNDGTLRGDVTPGQDGLAGTTGYDYGGTDGRVEVPDDPSLLADDELTVSLWVRTTNFSSDAQTMLLDKNDFGASQGVAIFDDGGFSDPGIVVFRVLGDGTYYDVSVPRSQLNDGDWHHVVGTRDAGEMVLYIDGQREDSRTDSVFEPAPVDVGIGAGPDGYGPLEGDMDDVRVYDRSLSDGEVEDLYNASEQGSLTTGTKTFDHAVSPGDLTLRNVSAVRPAGTSVTVRVHSDPDGDGTFQETSDAITLDGSANYDVTGLTSESRRFRVEIELRTTDPTLTPTVDRLELAE